MRWNDVRHCFLQSKCRECERWEEHESLPEHSPKATATPQSRALASTTASERDEPQSRALASTTASARDEPQSRASSSAMNSAHKDSQPFKALTTTMSTLVRPQNDYWLIEENRLIRVHRTPRRVLFTPQCAQQCPLSTEFLNSSRNTEIAALTQATNVYYLSDDWKQNSMPHRDLGYLWIGRTLFWRTDTSAKICEAQLDSTSSVAKDSNTMESFLDMEDFPTYSGDVFPEHCQDDRVAEAKKKYCAIPEEFYTQTGRRLITPQNAEKWLQQIRKKGFKVQFWEWCSGSGRLSLMTLLAGLCVGFPLDYRYGWDIGHGPHQKIISQIQAEILPDELFAAPTCTPWSVSSNGKDPVRREAERHFERPALEFVHDSMLWQYNRGSGFTLEQPIGSAVFKEEPISRLGLLPGVRCQQLDQCMHGATDEKQQPIRKATGLLSNRRWKAVFLRCNGHRGRPHGQLQGQLQGVNRTARAAVYPKRMCHRMAADLWRFTRNCQLGKLCPRSLFWAHRVYYKRIRCQVGRAAVPGLHEHTHVPGECRYGQPRHRGVPSALSAASADPLHSFKKTARRDDYSMVHLDVDATIELMPEPRIYLKAALHELVQSCVGIFSEAAASSVRGLRSLVARAGAPFGLSGGFRAGHGSPGSVELVAPLATKGARSLLEFGMCATSSPDRGPSQKLACALC